MTAFHDATDQAETLRHPAGRNKERSAASGRLNVREGLRVISVTSGRNGAGKSTVVVNVAESLAALGKRVLIIDAEPGNVISRRLGLEARYTLQHVVSGVAGMEDVLIDAGKGISILPAAMAVHKYTALSPSGRSALMQGLLRLQNRFDYYLIDSGAGVSANATGFAVAAREVMLVVTSEPASLTEAYSLMKTLYSRDESLRFSVVVNNCRSGEEAASVHAKFSLITGRFLKLSIENLGAVLHDDTQAESIRRSGSLCRLFPDSLAAIQFRAVAQKIVMEGEADAFLMPIDTIGAKKQWRNHELSS